MAVDLDEFDRLFSVDPVATVKKVFNVPEARSKPVIWKGKTIAVYDYELFVEIIRGWMRRHGWTKEQSLDEFFDMFES